MNNYTNFPAGLWTINWTIEFITSMLYKISLTLLQAFKVVVVVVCFLEILWRNLKPANRKCHNGTNGLHSIWSQAKGVIHWARNLKPANGKCDKRTNGLHSIWSQAKGLIHWARNLKPANGKCHSGTNGLHSTWSQAKGLIHWAHRTSLCVWGWREKNNEVE